MKRTHCGLILVVVAVLLSTMTTYANEKTGSPADHDTILKKYVTGDYFQYGKLKENKEDLASFARFLRWQAKADVKQMSRADQIAFYINAYNSCCIKAMLDHYRCSYSNSMYDNPGAVQNMVLAGATVTLTDHADVYVEWVHERVDHADIATQQGFFFNGIEWVLNWHF